MRRWAHRHSNWVNGSNLAALVYTHAVGARCHKNRYGQRLCTGAPRILVPKGGVTIGNYYTTYKSRSYFKTTTGKLELRHERIHSRQWSQYGLTFGYLYIRAEIRGRGHGSCHNYFERQANCAWGGY